MKNIILLMYLIFGFNAFSCDENLTGKFNCTNNLNDENETVVFKYYEGLIYFPSSNGDGLGFEFGKVYKNSWEEVDYYDEFYFYESINRYSCDGKSLIVEFKMKETTNFNNDAYFDEINRKISVKDGGLEIIQNMRSYILDTRDGSVIVVPKYGQKIFNCNKI